MITLKNHIGTVHELNILFECSRCAKKFTEEKFLRLHIEKVHTKATNEGTKVSPKNKKSKEDPKAHNKVHKQKKFCKFFNCKFSTHQPSLMKRHVEQVHEGKVRHHCYQCTYQCWEESNMELHVSEKHKEIESSEIENLECKTCEVSFGAKDAFVDHMKRFHAVPGNLNNFSQNVFKESLDTGDNNYYSHEKDDYDLQDPINSDIKDVTTTRNELS